MADELISRRTLNRATLERQLLLRRAAMPVLRAVRHLVALNAQDPQPPYLALWARLAGVRRDALTALVNDRSVVRSALLRGTQHMVAATDYRWLRPLLQPVLQRVWNGAFGRYLKGVDLAALAAATRHELGDGRVLTRPELRDRLAARFPGREPQALGWSAQALLPIVHPPPVGTWYRRGPTSMVLAEHWLGEPLEADPLPEELIRRYLAALGPATVADIQAWSGLTRLREVVERMRPLPEFDNLVLAHADRTRVMTDAQRSRVCVGAATAATVLVDGFVAGIWTMRRQDEHAIFEVEPLARLSSADRLAIADEAAQLLSFAVPDAQHDIRC